MNFDVTDKRRQLIEKTDDLFSEAGFTLVELLIALVMSVVVVGAVYYTFNSQQKSFSLINQKMDMQQEGRAALNFLMRDFRMAGARVPKAKAMVIIDATDRPDQVSLLFASPEEYFLSGYIIVSSANGNSDSIVVETMTGGSFAPRNTYYRNKNIMLVKRDGSHGVIRKIARATGSGTQRTFALETSPASTVFGDTQADITADYSNQYAFIVSANSYHVKSGTLYINPNNGGRDQALAENVEDLQLAYVDKHGTWYCDSNSNTLPPSSIADIRGVRINVLVRTRVPDPDFRGQRPAIEDHDAASSADHYRRRWIRSFVMVRNMVY